MNKTIHVSAPGSVMLMGEHAVLHGHQAIACAVDKRIHLYLRPRADKLINIHSELAVVNGSIDALPQHPQLEFCLQALRLQTVEQGFDLEIKSEFLSTVGLGSSAAVTAAMVLALALLQGQQLSNCMLFARALDVILQVQGRGSGSDLAASIYGGMVGYTIKPRRIVPLLQAQHSLPQLDLFYSGYKTTTPAVLAQVAAYTSDYPSLYADLYQQMHKVTIAAQAAIGSANWLGLGHLMNHYHGLLDALGVNDINLASIVFATRAQAGVYGAKISGSGLGDCVLSLARRGSKLLSDYLHIPIEISRCGVMLHEEAS